MKYEQQLFYKNQEVQNNLKRIGKIELPDFEPILGSENQFFYRNKMEFGFSDTRWLTEKEIQSADTTLSKKPALGFHIPRMWDKILNIETCHLQADPSNAIRNGVRDFAIKHEISFFNARNHSGLLRTLMIRTTSIGEIMVLVQFFADNKKQRELVMNYLIDTFTEITSFQYVINE
jgi:23S rRNA (uracil1939-C5)-methyltransferase